MTPKPQIGSGTRILPSRMAPVPFRSKIRGFEVIADVPLAYLASFRRKRCPDCVSYDGFVRMFSEGRRTFFVCGCAIFNARRKLAEIGRDRFEAEATEWTEANRERIERQEEKDLKELKELYDAENVSIGKDVAKG